MSTTYQTRPVFDFPLNWSQVPNAPWNYDLRKMDVAFGPLRFAPVQKWVVSGAEISLDLRSEQAIEDYESFCDALRGRLYGFWLPAPWAAISILSGGVGTNVYLDASGLETDWALKPDLHLAFAKTGQTTQYAKITNVVDEDGQARITLDTSVTADSSWTCMKLLYVRFASDTEEATTQGENWQSRTVRVVELPGEYVAYETGSQPIYFYRMWYGGLASAPSAANDWFYTSFQGDLSSTYNGLIASQVHTSKPINHGELTNSMAADAVQTTITATLEAGTPWARLVPMISPRALWVEIRKASWATPNVTTVIFTGQILKGSIDGLQMKMTCASILDALRRRILHKVYQQGCNHTLYDADTCKVVEATFTVAVTISTITGRKVTVTGAGLAGKVAGWFAYGKLKVGSGRNLQIVDIQSSAAAVGTSVDLVLTFALFSAVVGNSATVAAGCDQTAATCTAKFANFATNYGGYVAIPRRNLTIEGLPTDASNGNKK